MDKNGFTLLKTKIAIAGLGLMGGSLALALKGKCAAIYGVDPQPAILEQARRQAIVDLVESDPAAIFPKANVIILAAPVPAIMKILEQIPQLTSNPCIVFDLGSSKGLICEAMSQLPERFDVLGGHPLCGKEKLSLSNAERTLFASAPFLLTPLERTSERALEAAKQIIEAIGAHSVTLDVADHDRLLASTSHLPYILSAALVLASSPDVAPFIGPGFRSSSRLAETSPTMMLGVLQSNRLNILSALKRFQAGLDEIASALDTNDPELLRSILERAQENYQSLIP